MSEHCIPAIAQAIEDLCSYIDVRHDENGMYIFALGQQQTHTLQLRKNQAQFVLELWHGKTAEEEVLTATPCFTNAQAAIEQARKWLQRDNV